MNHNKVATLVDDIRNSFPDFKVTPANFKAPSKDFVFQFYSTFFEEFGFDLKKLLELSGNQLLVQTSSALFQDALQYINVSQFISGFLQKISPSQAPAERFGFSDLISPTPSRTLAFISLAMNFFSFADAYLTKLQDRYGEVSERKQKYSDLLAEREKYLAEINHRASCKVKGHYVSEQIKQKKKEMCDLEEELKSLDRLSSLKQAEIDNISKTISRLQDTASKLQDKIKALELQLVQSPDALKSEHVHLMKKLDESKQRLKDAGATITGKKEVINLLEEINRNEDERQAVLSMIIETAKKIKEAEKELASISQSTMSTLSKISETEGEKSKLNEELSKLGEHIVTLQLQWDKNKSSLQENLRHKKEEKSHIESKQGVKFQAVIDRLEEERKRFREHKALYHELCEFYEQSYSKLLEKEKEFVKRKEEEHHDRVQNFQNFFKQS